MRRPRGRFFNRAVLARTVGVVAVAAALAATVVYLATHHTSPKTITLSLPSSSSILIEDEA